MLNTSFRPPESIENQTVTSPSTVQPVNTSLLSFDGTVASVFPNTRPSPTEIGHATHRRSQSCGDESDKKSKPYFGPEKRHEGSKVMATSGSRQGSMSSPSSYVTKSVFVQGVGWASQVDTEEMLTSIYSNGRLNPCTMRSCSIHEIEYGIIKMLLERVKNCKVSMKFCDMPVSI